MDDAPKGNVYRRSHGRRSGTTSPSSVPPEPATAASTSESVVNYPSHEGHTTDGVDEIPQSSVSTNTSNISPVLRREDQTATSTTTSAPVTRSQETSILRSTSSARRQSRRRTSSDRLTNLSYRASSVAVFMVSAEEIGSILAEVLDFIPDEKRELVDLILTEAEEHGQISYEVFNQLDLLGYLTTPVPSFNEHSFWRNNIEPRVEILSHRFDIDALSSIAEMTPMQTDRENGNRNQPIPGNATVSSSVATTEETTEDNNVLMRGSRSSNRRNRSSYQSRNIEEMLPGGANVSAVASLDETETQTVPMRPSNIGRTSGARQSLHRASIRGDRTSQSTTTNENASGRVNTSPVIRENKNETQLPILRTNSGRRCTTRESDFRSTSQPLTEQDRGNRISAAISRLTLTSGPFIVSAKDFCMLVDEIIDYIPDENREVLNDLLLTAKQNGQIDYKAFNALDILQFVQTPITETIPEETDAEFNDDTEMPTLPVSPFVSGVTESQDQSQIYTRSSEIGMTTAPSQSSVADEAATDYTEEQVIESLHDLPATHTSEYIEDVAANADANTYADENVTEYICEIQALPTIEHTDDYATYVDESDHEVTENVHEIQTPATIEYAADSAANIDAAIYSEDEVTEIVYEVQAPHTIEYTDDSAANVDTYSIPLLAEYGATVYHEPEIVLSSPHEAESGSMQTPSDIRIEDRATYERLVIDRTHTLNALIDEEIYDTDDLLNTEMPDDLTHIPVNDRGLSFESNISMRNDEEIITFTCFSEVEDYLDDSNRADEHEGTLAEEDTSDTMTLVNMTPHGYIHNQDDEGIINETPLHTNIPRIHHVNDDEQSNHSIHEASIPVGLNVDEDEEGIYVREDDQGARYVEHDDNVDEIDDTADIGFHDPPSLGRDNAAEQMRNIFEIRNPQHQSLDQTEAAAEAVDSFRTVEEYLGELAELLPELTHGTLRRHVTSCMTDGVVDRAQVFNSLHEVDQKSLRRWIRKNLLQGTILININQHELLYSLLSFYKQASAEKKKEKLKKIPRIRFEGERGIDAGALTREFFNHGMESFFKGPFQDGPIFEGAPDHIIPCVSIIHRESNVYQTFGTFLAHSLLHGCGGAVGLAPCIKAVLSSNIPLEIKSLRSNIEISIDDVPDFELQEFLRKIQDTPSEVKTLDSTFLQYVEESGFSSGTLRPDHYQLLLQHLLIYFVIIKRRAELKEIRKGMNQLGLYKFLCDNHTVENLEDVFPSLADIVLSPNDITDHLDTSHVRWSPKLQFFLNFVKELHEGKHDGVGLAELLQFWTGSSTPPANLELKLQHSGPFPLAHACFNLLELPAMCATYKDFVDNFVTALTCGARGFGMA